MRLVHRKSEGTGHRSLRFEGMVLVLVEQESEECAVFGGGGDSIVVVRDDFELVLLVRHLEGGDDCIVCALVCCRGWSCVARRRFPPVPQGYRGQRRGSDFDRLLTLHERLESRGLLGRLESKRLPTAAAQLMSEVAAPGAGSKKTTTKAERRAMQEKQRAEKEARRNSELAAAQTTEKTPRQQAHQKQTQKQGAPTSRPGQQLPHDDAKVVKDLQKKQITPRTHAHKQVPLFAHLPQYEREASLTSGAIGKSIHPAVLRLGLQLADGVVSGTKGRMVGMLRALQAMINDFTCPPTKVFSRELEGHLKSHIQYLTDCRPKSLAMGDAIKWLKCRIAQIPPHLNGDDARKLLSSQLDMYIDERIVLADEAIASTAAQKIAPGDVILIFGHSYVVEQTLLRARASNVEFSVIVIDSGPRHEGRDVVCRLMRSGIRCAYALLHALSYLMCEVSKVFLGASNMLLNGFLVGRSGASLVAMCAHEHGVPVLVLCETYKFTERLLLDSICYNELGDPDELVPPAVGCLNPDNISDWRDMPKLKLLNLIYDVTPMKFLTLIVTEAGVIPPTSVPVIIREDSARTQLQSRVEYDVL